jgi:hypothetical protein
VSSFEKPNLANPGQMKKMKPQSWTNDKNDNEKWTGVGFTLIEF